MIDLTDQVRCDPVKKAAVCFQAAEGGPEDGAATGRRFLEVTNAV